LALLKTAALSGDSKQMALTQFTHIEPRRGTLKRFKNGGKCLLNFSK